MRFVLNAEDLTVQSVPHHDNVVIPSEILDTVVSVLAQYKAEDVVTFQCSDDYFTDFIVVATCTSDRHISGISDKLLQALKKQHPISPLQSPNSGGWVCIDAKSVIVHLMSKSKRMKYDIEELMLSIGNKKLSH